ncbi:MAG: peptidoglycan DD-metalloendopeptidase family protein [Hyphomicrobiaceae bacterium]|nr:peptidoglycan DD-metalloendopeptidase family protein [Hyphomicrobiaceae bacterium]
MKSFQRIGRYTSGAGKPGALLSALTLALTLGGCSADVGRFDVPAFNLNGKSDETASIPTPSEPMSSGGPSLAQSADRSSGYIDGTYVPPSSGRSNRNFEIAALPDVPPAQAPRESYATSHTNTAPYQPPRATYQPARSAARPAPAPTDNSDGIEVQRGDTLYSLARRNNVTVKELMAANSLSSPMIHPGQRLRMPGSGGTIAAPQETRPAPRSHVAAAPRVPVAENPSNWGGSYTVQPGDSLFKIARTHNVRTADLQSANAITNPRQLKPGAVIRVPGANTTPTFAEAKAAPREEQPATPPNIASTTQPTVINSERQVAALTTNRMIDAPAAPAAPAASAEQSGVAKPVQTVSITPSQVGVGKLRWPSKGKVISGFGQRTDGTHNDGINIALPIGADVHAAEEGEVAYAGSELKGYGNLILLRHDNGWVTAYAHADQMLVKRGDKVRRGDIIAKAGKTGQVDQPQLHFELRQGSKPVDPLPYLDRL